MKSTFDYVIVGAGSAGCVLANRLSAKPSNSVCLLEAGPKTDSIFIRMPAALTFPIESKTYNWAYSSEPESQLNNRSIGQARGRGLGGCSAINGMVFVRGNPRDFDNWSAFGLDNWSYADCLPYFKKLESYQGACDQNRGHDGPVSVVESKAEHVFYQRFLRAAEQWGLPTAVDYNGCDQHGAHLTQSTIRNGIRCSSYEAYVAPILQRNNLSIRSTLFVNKIRFDGTRAIGVEAESAGNCAIFEAQKEVILCTGTIGSPQILMLSGIGNADHLQSQGIHPLIDLPGVGENLQDHIVAPLRYHSDKPVSLKRQLGLLGRARIGMEWLLFKRGLGASNFFEVGAFFNGGSGTDYINMQHEFLPFLADFQDGKVVLGDGFQYFVSQMRPYSRGCIRLKSADPKQHPAIHFNYLDDPRDIKEMIDGIKLTREMANQSAWDEFRSSSLDPELENASDAEITAWLRKSANTEHHPAGTCRMGDDSLAVTDDEGHVHGSEALRIVDGSIIPAIPTANLHAPITMMAEKIADKILVNS